MKNIKNFLNSNSLTNSFYDPDMDLYDLEFVVDNPEDGKTYLVSVSCVKAEDEAAEDEFYFDDDEVLKKLISETPEENITFVRELEF